MGLLYLYSLIMHLYHSLMHRREPVVLNGKVWAQMNSGLLWYKAGEVSDISKEHKRFNCRKDSLNLEEEDVCRANVNAVSKEFRAIE